MIINIYIYEDTAREVNQYHTKSYKDYGTDKVLQIDYIYRA